MLQGNNQPNSEYGAFYNANDLVSIINQWHKKKSKWPAEEHSRLKKPCDQMQRTCGPYSDPDSNKIMICYCWNTQEQLNIFWCY